MDFDYSKLRGKIVEMCGTQKNFSELMGTSYASISAKLNNKVQFSQEDIAKAIEILKLQREEISVCFFCPVSSEILNHNK